MRKLVLNVFQMLFVSLIGAGIAVASEPIAPTVEPSAEMRDNPQCGMMLLLLTGPVPAATDVGIPAFPGAVFSGATGPGTAELNNVQYEVLGSVFLLTEADPVTVAEFYRASLDDSWQQGTVFGSHVFYQHEPVDDVVDLLFERPGALPVVEIVEVWSACDRLLVPGAVTAIRLYYPPKQVD